jgi:hypothetical protein
LNRPACCPGSSLNLIEHLTNEGFSEADAETTLRLEKDLGLVGVDDSPALNEPILFNEHAFIEKPSRIAAALNSLDPQDRQCVVDIQTSVEGKGCVSYDDLVKQFPQNILRLMEGLGLLDRQEVISPFGNALFATLPQTLGVYGQKSGIGLGIDCFHHAKMLLCCLRYGTARSVYGRGRIQNPIDILNSLLRGNWVGPCTAIGEDYQVLEREGVISTRKAREKPGQQFYMRLRKREVGELAKQVFLYGRGYTDTGIFVVPDSSPSQGYVNPQDKRAEMMAQPVGPIEELRARLLVAVRT